MGGVEAGGIEDWICGKEASRFDGYMYGCYAAH